MNWQRSVIKSNAKISLRETVGVSYLVSLVALLLSGGVITFLCNVQFFFTYGSFGTLLQSYLRVWQYFGGQDSVRLLLLESLWNLLVEFLPFLLLADVVHILIGAAARVGSARYYVHKRFGDTRFGVLFSGFEEKWMHTVLVTWTTDLLVLFFSLLLVVPGIVKYYQYYYVDFLLSDNPGLSPSRARALSQMLSAGEKGQLFLLDLSFLGWYLLVLFTSVPTFGWSSTFLLPYLYSTRAELYLYVRDRAIQNGQIAPAELRLLPLQPPIA